MTTTQPRTTDRLFDEAMKSFEHWELLRELIDESIDLALNYRQSGHPGGSRSKVHMFLALLLSGAMRWDLKRPWRPFMDRLVFSAGHTVPLVRMYSPPLASMTVRSKRSAPVAASSAIRWPSGVPRMTRPTAIAAPLLFRWPICSPCGC